MPFVQINVPAGSLDAERKQAMIAEVTDAVVEAEGVEAVRDTRGPTSSTCPTGGWGMAGRAVTLAQVQAALTRSPGPR